MRDSIAVSAEIIELLGRALADNPFLARAAVSPSAPPVDVVIPIYNASHDLTACVASVASKTSHPFRLVLINDGSTDPQVSRLLQGIHGATAHLVVIDRPTNRGFVHTVNEGCALSSSNDVVILNSDTIVSPRWLEKMIAVAHVRPNVATVTPLTNNGTLCSVPQPFEDNDLPYGYDIDSFAALIEETSLELFPEAPTGVGFCMLITRRALEAVGQFDAATFGLGYAEENDFCQRAIAAGFVNLIADNVFILHKGRRSFEARTEDLLARNLAQLATKHPAYAADVARYIRDHPLRLFHKYLAASIGARRGRAEAIRTRVLHMLHFGGGTEKHARDLAAIEDDHLLSYVSTTDGRTLDVDEYYAGRQLRSFRFPLSRNIGEYGPLRDAAYRDALATLCWTLKIDLIHVHHLRHNTLDIAEVATQAGIPYVMTLHDYHTVCPMYTLLNPNGDPCGACTGAKEYAAATACMALAGRPMSYLLEYQTEMRHFLAGAAAIFAPSQRVQDVVGSRFPELAQRITVVEHGHRFSADIEASGPGLPTPPAVPRVRPNLHVAVIGGIDLHKGSKVLRALLRANRREDITFHLYGTSPDPDITLGGWNRIRRLDGSKFIYHGPYRATDIVRRLIADNIDVGLQLAIWSEAFSFTLSEFVEAGIPVIAGNLGAQGERIERCRLGWTVSDIRNPGLTLAILDSIIESPGKLDQVARGMRRREALPPIETMWGRYAEVYCRVLSDAGASMKRYTPSMERNTPGADAPFSHKYVAFLAMSLAERQPSEPVEEPHALELEHLRQRLSSDRHRVADAIGDMFHKIPVLRSVVAASTRFWVARLIGRTRA